MADQSTLKALRNKLSDLEDELDTAHEAQAELEKQLGQLKSDLEAKEEKLQSALTEAKDASERCASSEARLQKLSEAQDAPAEASSPPDSADQSEEVARLRAELQELQRSLKTSQMETKKLEEELKTAEQQQKEAVQQEKKRAEGLTSEIQQLQRSQQETAQAEAQKLKAVEAEYRNECQRLQQLCQELESDRDTALERMQRAEETLKQQMQQFQEFSKKNAAEARAGVEAMGKELEARNARIAQQQAELQRQAQAMAEEQRKAQELQEQLTAYVGTHQVGYTQIHLRRASSAEASFVGCHGFQGECEVQEVWMETLDHLLLGDVPPVDLLKIHVQGSELDVLRGAREALRQGRICVTYVMTHAARIGQFEEVSSEEVVKAYLEIFSNHSVVASDGLTLGIPLQAVPAALKEEDKNYFVIAWHEGRLCRERPSVQAARELFGEVLAAKKWCQLQFSIGHSKCCRETRGWRSTEMLMLFRAYTSSSQIDI